MKTIDLAILGFGVIGSGFSDVLLKKERFLEDRFGIKLRVVAIGEYSGSLINPDGIDLKSAIEAKKNKKPLSELPDWKSGVDSKEILKTTNTDIVVEVVPSNINTGNPGKDLIRTALENGAHVVSSDKCAIASDFPGLKDLASKKGLELKYEASAGGAMPLMNLIHDCLQINEVESLEGILNGTTNYILTKMQKGGMTLNTALREAQELGYAEADPTYDIDGVDTAAKLVILANDIFGLKKSFEDVDITGITQINKDAVGLAKTNKYSIKLIGEIKEGEVSVGPKLVPIGHPLDVDGSLNAVMFETDIARDVTIIGRGAGGLETQSAIFSDLISIINDSCG